MKKLAVSVFAVAVWLVIPQRAHAIGDCYGAIVDGYGGVEVCVEAAPVLNADGTVGLEVDASCQFHEFAFINCEQTVISPDAKRVDATGFVPNQGFPPPCVDPSTGTIRSEGGELGTVYIDGTPVPLTIPGFVLGSTSGC